MEKYLNKTVRITNIPGMSWDIRGTVTKVKGYTFTIGTAVKVAVDENTVIEIIENEE